jgi:hypothetical protein
MKDKLTDDELTRRAQSQDMSPDKALYWLSYNAGDIGEAYSRMKHADLQRKIKRAEEYDKAIGTNKDREMTALQSAAYESACNDYANACADYMTLSVLKEAAVLKIQLYQSRLKHSREGHPS